MQHHGSSYRWRGQCFLWPPCAVADGVLEIQLDIHGILPRSLYHRIQERLEFNRYTTGFLVWEFPTVYIAQKLRLAKYLGNHTSYVTAYAQRTNSSSRLQRHSVGHYFDVPRSNHQFRCILRSAVLTRYDLNRLITSAPQTVRFQACANAVLRRSLY